MSVVEVVQTTAKATSSSSSGFVLQRKCVCGGSAGFSGECEECKSKKLLGKPLQHKLAINEPGDEYEREADRVADQVMRIPEASVDRDAFRTSPAPLVQRRVSGSGTAGVGTAPQIVHDVLNSPGQPLDSATRTFFEPRFGHDFSHVRIHADAKAADSARAVNAQAYTIGEHVIFGAGQYSDPANTRRLLAHELAHVVQQGNVQRRSEAGTFRGPRQNWLGIDGQADPMAYIPTESHRISRPSVTRGAIHEDLAQHSAIQRHSVQHLTSTATPVARLLQRQDKEAVNDDLEELLIIRAATFDEAAQNVAAILSAEGERDPAKIVVVSGSAIRVFDQNARPVTTTTYRFRVPVEMPIGVFRAVGEESMLRAILRDPSGQTRIGGYAGGRADFTNDIEQQAEFDQALGTTSYIYYVSPATTLVSDSQYSETPQVLPEFMQFVGEEVADLSAWPAAVVPLTPQITTVNSTGSFLCRLEKNIGVNTIDRMTNLLQTISFRWEVLKLNTQLRPMESHEPTRFEAVQAAYARRLRNIEADRQTLLGEDQDEQTIVEQTIREWVATGMTSNRKLLAIAGETAVTITHLLAGDTNQPRVEDFIDVPWKEPGDYFVRCLATPVSSTRESRRRATSIAGAMVSVFHIEDVARESLPTVEIEQELTFDRLFDLHDELEGLRNLKSSEAVASGAAKLRIRLLELERDYLSKAFERLGDTEARKRLELAYIRSQLAYLAGDQLPQLGQNDRKFVDRVVKRLREQETELSGLLERAASQFSGKRVATAMMPAVLVDEATGARSQLTFLIGEREYFNRNELEVNIADITGKTGRVFSGRGTGRQGEGRRDAWGNALRDLRQHLKRGRGYLAYRVPPPYDSLSVDVPNPMQLQLAPLDQLKELADESVQAASLAALVAAPFTEGVSLQLLVVLAPIQAGSSLYNVVDESMYQDFHLDLQAVDDFINIGSFGLGMVGAASKSVHGLAMVATGSNIGVRLLDGGGYIKMSYETYQAIMRPEVEGEDPREARRRRLMALLSAFQEGATLGTTHLLAGGAERPVSRERRSTGQSQFEQMPSPKTLKGKDTTQTLTSPVKPRPQQSVKGEVVPRLDLGEGVELILPPGETGEISPIRDVPTYIPSESARDVEAIGAPSEGSRKAVSKIETSVAESSHKESTDLTTRQLLNEVRYANSFPEEVVTGTPPNQKVVIGEHEIVKEAGGGCVRRSRSGRKVPCPEVLKGDEGHPTLTKASDSEDPFMDAARDMIEHPEGTALVLYKEPPEVIQPASSYVATPEEAITQMAEQGVGLTPRPDAALVRDARAALNSGTATVDQERLLLLDTVADARQFIEGTRPVNRRSDDAYWFQMMGACGIGRDCSAASLAALAEHSLSPVMIDRFQAKTALGFGGHAFLTVTFPEGTRYLVDPTFVQFLGVPGERIRRGSPNITEALSVNPHDLELAAVLARDGVLPLNEETAGFYVRSMAATQGSDVDASKLPDLTNTLLHGPGTESSERVGIGEPGVAFESFPDKLEIESRESLLEIAEESRVELKKQLKEVKDAGSRVAIEQRIQSLEELINRIEDRSRFKPSEGPEVLPDQGRPQSLIPAQLERAVAVSSKLETHELTQQQKLDEAAWIDAHPEIITGTPPHRKAKIGAEGKHEIVETPSGRCKRKSNGPREVPCGKGMGKVEDAKGEQVDDDLEEEGQTTEEIPLGERIREPIGNSPPPERRDWDKYVFEGRQLGIVDTYQGPQAWYIRSGEGGDPGHGGPAKGDPAPFFGIAIVLEIDKDTKIPIPEKAPSPWVLKPEKGRLGKTGTSEYFMNKDLLDWLKNQTPLPAGKGETDIGIINKWLRDNGIEPERRYKVGDEVTLSKPTDLTTLPNTVDYYEQQGIIYQYVYKRIIEIP